MKVLIATLVTSKDHVLHQARFKTALNLQSNAVILVLDHISEPVRHFLARTITVKGYLVSDHYHRIEEGQAALSKWVKDDKIKFKEHINEGIENCLDTYNLLFSGGNEGKLMLKL